MKPTTVHYGSHRAQVAEVWRPSAPGDRPVLVLLHGGFWRQVYTKRLMHGLARAVADLGWVAFNVEYRRVGPLGSGGWPGTFDDVSAAVDAIGTLEGVDQARVVTCGHSAGGHLALWAASARVTGPEVDHPVRPCAAISLAGVVDLVGAARQGLGGGAVEALMGGAPGTHPDRYALGSPAALLPGEADRTVPASLSRDYVSRATALGDDARYVPLAGASHMDMISAHGPAFDTVASVLREISPRGP
jgi:acetyl esterase/lipase